MATNNTYNILCDVHTIGLRTTTPEGVVTEKKLKRNHIELEPYPDQDALAVYGYELGQPNSWESFVLQVGITYPELAAYDGVGVPANVTNVESKEVVSQELSDIWAGITACITSCCGTI